MKLYSFFRFGIIGALGFFIDAGVLYLLLLGGLDYFLGRIISFLLAVLFTWQLNRRFTFKVKPSFIWWQEAWRYLGVSSLGGVVNLCVYSLVIIMAEPSSLIPLIGVALGSIAGMGVNYLAARKFVFHQDLRD